jgi:hypothetical protein
MLPVAEADSFSSGLGVLDAIIISCLRGRLPTDLPSKEDISFNIEIRGTAMNLCQQAAHGC